MSKGRLTSDPRAMDVHLQANAQLHYGVNGAASQNSRPGQDEALQFLSPAEQECLQFFEETIDSLEESLEQDELRPQLEKPHESSSRRPVEEVDGPPTSSPKPGVTVSSLLARATSAKDHDIIDLVRPEPDLVQTKEPVFSPTNPDFQTILPTPDSHFEIKPRRDPMDTLPSEYNPPLPSGSYGPDSLASYHPPGCIPTPVLIAQKIAENQAGPTSSIHPSVLLRRCSLESEKSPSQSADLPVKHGPPTSAKPTRFPANISVILGNKEHQNESLANVNIQERRAQMLANLTGTSHPLLQEDPQQAQKERNTPTRSVSFRDPTPDKSRMEALSKLGLTRNRAMSGGMSLPHNPLEPLKGAESSKPVEDDGVPAAETSLKEPEISVTSPTQTHVDRKPEILQTDPAKIHDDQYPSPPAFVHRNYSPPPPLEIKPPLTPPSEVSSPEFNSYGGKSIVVHPPISSKGETTTSPTSPEFKTLPPALANPTEFNTYGGKSKVLTPTPVAVTRSDLPDILSSHIDKTQTLPARSDPLPIDLNSYGGKSRTFNPSAKLNPPADSPARTSKVPAPTPAPRPPRHSYHGIPTSVPKAQRAPSPDHRRRPASMFRPQGITVQFSGRGATDESRREALRRLGLLKDS
ncbi:proline and serine-rich protein 2 isoform X1 [Sphaeramia orbicularis]|uniref:proline and serine-rich protein 2 isoform X1 n=1 Tax=Sphaeramia orbicularis TaxID=375764 RepID=UPI00117C9372|nr:proline and serine-rich protein 2 isoform X1 [Sphaeramia orbicularis]XP_030004465.1 proline and serine-rich protein 2 isoform X1 [Sphaeramia orbicularis]XP_030004466.1 proline and serine-rich protein 2 isoform X1 [Sphaeramia orbicularis]